MSRLFIRGWIIMILVAACAGPPPVREANYPTDCKKGQTVKELFRRGNVHRDMMMRERPSGKASEEQWVQVRGIHGARARTCYQLVLDQNPDDAHALLNYGFTYIVKSGFPDLSKEARDRTLVSATEYVQRAQKAQPLDAHSYYYLGEIAARRGQCDRAERIFNALLTSRWIYSHVYVWLGYCYESTAKPQQAKEAYTKAAEISNPIPIAEWARRRIK